MAGAGGSAAERPGLTLFCCVSTCNHCLTVVGVVDALPEFARLFARTSFVASQS
jgi:hypothetical protein